MPGLEDVRALVRQHGPVAIEAGLANDLKMAQQQGKIEHAAELKEWVGYFETLIRETREKHRRTAYLYTSPRSVAVTCACGLHYAINLSSVLPPASDFAAVEATFCPQAFV